jgi:two-component system, LytTR family, response regulator
MKAIIVDDEPKAIELLQGYLLHFPQVELMSTFRNGLKALAYMQENPVDLVFLDINMPHLSGISLSKMLEKSIKVIFITAHAEYAPESYDVEAVDYLMKPVSFERFTKAIQKVLRSKPVVQDNSTANAEAINLKSTGNVYRVLLADILYLEKAANYMAYHLLNKKILIRQSAAEALEELPAYFIQVHKSFIVNSTKIDYYNKDEIDIGGIKVPIGNMHRDRFLNLLIKK